MAPTYDVRRYPATRAVLNGGPPIVVQADDPGADPAERALMRPDDSETLLLLPLRAARHVVGLVELSTVARRRELLGHELDFCLSMADQAGAVLETARLVEQLRRAADIDQVTGVGSHRLLQERLSQEVARADQPLPRR